jgi:hypothetical protein
VRGAARLGMVSGNELLLTGRSSRAHGEVPEGREGREAHEGFLQDSTGLRRRSAARAVRSAAWVARRAACGVRGAVRTRTRPCTAARPQKAISWTSFR